MFRCACNFLLLLICALFSFASPLLALEFAPIFSSKMVLQRDKPVTVWGRGTPSAVVDLTIGAQNHTASIDAGGNWQIILEPMTAGGPYQLKISERGSSAAVTLSDILYGDVWVSSGQSNMEWRVEMTKDAAQTLAQANFPKIRLFQLARAAALTPQYGLTGAGQNLQWHLAAQTDLESVKKFSGVAYHFGRALHQATGVPIGLINASWGGTAIDPWTPAFAYGQPPVMRRPGAPSFENPTHLYNGMIHPLSKMAIKGFIWYQGEANLSSGAGYTAKQVRLIQSWRQAFAQNDLSFYYVQLAPFVYPNSADDALPIIWEAQAKVMSQVGGTGMVVTNDIGNLTNIHPTEKRLVGERLARWARNKDYQQTHVVYSGPVVKSWRIEGEAIIVTFDHVGKGLVSRDGKPLSWFTVAGDDGKFFSATKVEMGSDFVKVFCSEVPRPRHVRFAWSQKAEPNLMNSEKLPAAAFRTGL
jgi:sialate O-acetylesterase